MVASEANYIRDAGTDTIVPANVVFCYLNWDKVGARYSKPKLRLVVGVTAD